MAKKVKKVSFNIHVLIFPGEFEAEIKKWADSARVNSTQGNAELGKPPFSKMRSINFHADQKPLLVVPGKVNKISTDMIIDTAAEVTVVSSRIANRIHYSLNLCECVN